MADSDRITLVIEGLPEDDGRVRLSAFMSQLQNLSATINKLDREANAGKSATYFQIAELSYNSPVRVVIEPHAIARQSYMGHLVLENLGKIADALVSDSDLHSIDYDILEDIRGLARPVGKQVKSATLIFNAHTLELTETVALRIDKALAVEDECDGAIEGMLEQINIHQGANTFHIFPNVGPRKVTCHFPSRLYDDAVAAVGRRVEVGGLLRFRSGASFPHQIAVTQIDAFPPESELPDWDDVRGRAPNATGELSSEAFVRELRDGWR